MSSQKSSQNWNSLIKPAKVIYATPDNLSNAAKVILKPLERGMGTTLGNALRRILLSSLRGAAVTSIRVPGIVHEFSSIPGVKEDLVDIILNLKSLPIRMNVANKKNVRLNVTGPCSVVASMIETGHDVEILNPHHLICTLASGAKLEMELVCETGKGYVPATSAREKESQVGIIYLDAIFNPIKKVTYIVENERIGQVTDYEKLVMNVETNGSVTPHEACTIAAKILQNQLQILAKLEEEEEVHQDKLEDVKFNPVLLKKIDELELSVRSQNCLKNDNIVYIGDLVQKTSEHMLKTQNFGRKSLVEIKEVLSNLGLKLGMEVPGWPPENIEELAKKYEDSY